MARLAIVEDEIIVNVFVLENELELIDYPDAMECPEGFGVGDKFVDGEFVRQMTTHSIADDETETI